MQLEVVSAGSELAAQAILPPSTPACLEIANRIGEVIRAAPQIDIPTHHVLHAGVYYRTVCVPAGVVIEGAMIKVPTTLVISGHATMLVGEGEAVTVQGYLVLACAAGRKQICAAHTDVHATMSFRTDARTVEEAEREFTDDADALISRNGETIAVITGD